MHSNIEKLERDLRLLKAYASVLTGGFIFMVIAGFHWHQAENEVIRARGLIIEDQAGRERILIGAPVPPAANRVRTDLQRVEEIWGPRFPSEYMDYYKGYRHDMNGILILDEAGFDRVAVGDPVPDPNIGKRIAPNTGMVVNDEQGFERTGYGLLKLDGSYRVGLGLDIGGREGLILTLDDDGAVGMKVIDGDYSIYVGAARAGDPLTGLQGPFVGLLVKDGDEVKHAVNVAAARP